MRRNALCTHLIGRHSRPGQDCLHVLCVLCEGVYVCMFVRGKQITHTFTLSHPHSHPHPLTFSYPHTHALIPSHIRTIIEVVNSCLEVMQEHSRSHIPCEGGGEEEGRGRRGGEGSEGEGRGGEGSGEERGVERKGEGRGRTRRGHAGHMSQPKHKLLMTVGHVKTVVQWNPANGHP